MPLLANRPKAASAIAEIVEFPLGALEDFANAHHALGTIWRVNTNPARRKAFLVRFSSFSGLGADAEGPVFLDEAVRHLARIECGGRAAFAVEQDQPARGVRAVRQLSHTRIGHKLRVICLGL
jgi:hypothetical protein